MEGLVELSNILGICGSNHLKSGLQNRNSKPSKCTDYRVGFLILTVHRIQTIKYVLLNSDLLTGVRAEFQTIKNILIN